MSTQPPAPLTKSARRDPNSRTPRVDAAERFFYASNDKPMGYVMSEVARQIELELNAVQALLRAQGTEPAKA